MRPNFLERRFLEEDDEWREEDTTYCFGKIITNLIRVG
jgi:hypothetical protein